MSDADADRYVSIEDGPETEWRVLGSRFLGRAFRAADEATALERLAAVRRHHHAATHHAWALRVGGPGSPVERCDDDGEPAGTAGRPLLGRLRAPGLHDALVVVTRYFGGTKLGTGGLARAYSAAAGLAVDAAPRRVVQRTCGLEVECEFTDLGGVEAAIARAGDDVLRVERVFDPRPRLRLAVRRSRAGALAAAFVEATAGRATVREE